MSQNYSMWHVFAVSYNHSTKECIDPSYYMLCLIIPHKSCPGKDFHLFIEPLIDDLQELWRGVPTFDSFQNRSFNLHAAVLWCIHDYPACSTMPGRVTVGYATCLHCDKDPLSHSMKGKICFIGHHRFLDDNDPWRLKTNLGEVHESTRKPQPFTAAELQAELEKVRCVRPTDSHPPKRKRNDQVIWKLHMGFCDLQY